MVFCGEHPSLTEHEGCGYYWFKTSLLAWLVSIGRGTEGIKYDYRVVQNKVPGLVSRLGSSNAHERPNLPMPEFNPLCLRPNFVF
jgi:hypothetical protein